MIKLDDWQKEILQTKGHICVCSGRQTGKSQTISILAAEEMVKEPNKRIIIISITEDQAELMILKILDYLEEKYKNLIAKGRKKPTKHQITLKNNSQVRCRPVGNTGNAVRGFTGDMLIADEAAFMPEDIWTAAKPTLLTTAGRIILVSTPNGKTGYFYECFVNKHNRFTTFHISSEEVIKERPICETWTQRQREEAIKFLEEEKKDMSETQYGQEYLGLFLDDLNQFFSDELINRRCILKRPSVKPKGYYYLGCDLARMGGDEITFEILYKAKQGDRIQHVESIVKTKWLTTQTEDKIIELDKIYDFYKIGIDAGAGTLGVSILDHLLQTPLKRKVVAINNRAVALDREGKKTQRLMKEDLYDNLRAMLERGDIDLLDDLEVKASLKSIQWELKKVANGLTKVRIHGRYAHIAEGLIRAAELAKERKGLNFRIEWV